MPEYFSVEAVVLQSRPLGEADNLLTLYTREAGRFNAAARGVRKPRSHLVSLAQPFVHARLYLFRGRTLPGLAQGEVLQAFRGLRGDPALWAAANVVADVCQALTLSQEPNVSLFQLLLWVLQVLEATAPGFRQLRPSPAPEGAPGPPRQALVAQVQALSVFVLAALRILGFGPHCQDCVECHRPVTGEGAFGPAAGGLLGPECAGRDPSAIRLNAAAVRLLQTEDRAAAQLAQRSQSEGGLPEECGLQWPDPQSGVSATGGCWPEGAAVAQALCRFVEQQAERPLRSWSVWEQIALA
ncbi:MAG: DNA repair protein RecO [Firmicutes bacterium]|nr:DNA repair protein RecO [Bacillota bacterium]